MDVTASLNKPTVTPTTATIDQGQNIYVNLPSSDSAMVLQQYPDAVYDSNVNGWLVGFNIYLMDAVATNVKG